jgi:hypothetical protein
MRQQFGVLLCSSVCTMSGICFLAVLPAHAAEDDHAISSKDVPMSSLPNAVSSVPKVTISNETTFFTEPLGTEGMVDFAAALNASLSKGVTSENNAAVAFWKVVGTKRIDPTIRSKYLALLGLSDATDQDGGWMTYDEFVKSQNGGEATTDETEQEAEDHFAKAMQKPWTRSEHLSVAALLDHNAPSLERLREAALRSRYFSPDVADESGEFALLNGVSEAREVGKQFAARAMLRLGEGDADAAWQDILTIYRLARLYSQRPFLVDRLVAATIEGIAHTRTVLFSQTADITTTQALQCRQQLRDLPPMPPMKDTINGERAFWLIGLSELAVRPDQQMVLEEQFMENALPADTLQEIHSNRELMRRLAAMKDLDWTEVFRLTNQRFDRAIEAISQPEPLIALEAIRRLDTNPDEASCPKPEAKPTNSFDTIDQLTPKAKAQCLEKMVHTTGLGGSLTPCCLCAVRTAIQHDLAQVAFVLAAYRHDHQCYPKTLSELTPHYAETLPKDPLGTGDFKYLSDGEHYLLYSVGPNGKDDGGRNHMTDWQLQEEDDAQRGQWQPVDENELLDESEDSTDHSADDIAIRTGVWGLKE